MSNTPYELPPIGWVASTLDDVAAAPAQGDEGAPESRIVLRPDLHPAMRGLAVGHEIIVVTWLDRADRSVLEVHPRGDAQRALSGVFSTRSPDRPNPIGLHQVHILAIDGTTLRVGGLEAVDGTPVLDLKPVLGPVTER